MSPSENRAPTPTSKTEKPKAVKVGSVQPKPFEVKVRQTSIRVYPLKRGEFQFRVYIGDKEKRVTRSSRAAIILEAERIATDIENGKVQAGQMTAADVQSWAHAQRLLTVDDPPLHVIVEEWKRLQSKAPNVRVDELAALWQRTRPRQGETHDPQAGRISALSAAMLESLEQSSQASGSRRYLTGFKHDLARFGETFGGRRVAEINSEEVQRWLRGLGVGARRQDNIRAELVTFFRFARDRGFLPEAMRTEPEKVPKIHKVSGEISYYRPSELRAFLAVADLKWIPWLAIQAFAGLRTSEVARLNWNAFDWKERRIYVPASVALKVRRRRRVPIEDNLFAWLTPWHDATGRLYSQKNAEGAWTKYVGRLSKAADLEWRMNDLRHAYGTYQMALHENFGQVAAWMGNSEAKVKSNYDGVASPPEAREWFSIQPDTEASAKLIVLPRR